VVVCVDPVSAPTEVPLGTLLPRLSRRAITYGIEPGADVTAPQWETTSAGSQFEPVAQGRSLGPLTLRVPGRHNVQNALAAVAVGLELEIGADDIRRGLESFRGADRRFQVKAESNGITIVDDYGHHPTEIRATLDAARARGANRIWAIFQPHRYTRTKFLMDDFAHCFEGCERVYVLDIYPASELPIPGVSSERLVGRMRELGFERAQYVSENDAIADVLENVRSGDLVLTVGAGNVSRVAEALAAQLADHTEAAARI